MSKTRRRVYGLVPSVAVVLLVGCQTIPGAASALFGKWELIKDADPNGTKIILVFDSFGNLSQVGTQTGNVTVTDTTVSGTTSVVGMSLGITTSTNLRFDGTFNADMTVATGTLFTEFNLFGTITSINEGPATMTKVP
jgi:hypothetical protein